MIDEKILIQKLQEQRNENITLLPEAHFHANLGINQAIRIINEMAREARETRISQTCKSCGYCDETGFCNYSETLTPFTSADGYCEGWKAKERNES